MSRDEARHAGFLNKAMPLVRFATDDYVEMDENGKVVTILGRTQEFLVNKQKGVVVCIFIHRDSTFKNIINFPYISIETIKIFKY